MTRTVILLGIVFLSACTTQVQTNPQRSATEELLISAAADRAANDMSIAVPEGSTVFIDAANFGSPDGKYAVAAIRANLLRHHLKMVEKREQAKVVVNLRAAALSTNQNETLVGIPSFGVPVPLSSGSLTIPELALYKDSDQEGIARFAATAYDAKTGRSIAEAEPKFGLAHDRKQTVLYQRPLGP